MTTKYSHFQIAAIAVEQAVTAISGERARQISVEKHLPIQDDQYTKGELIAAASCYAEIAARVLRYGNQAPLNAPMQWPWAMEHWKPSHDANRMMEKAGALVLAQYENSVRKELYANNDWSETEDRSEQSDSSQQE